MANYDELNNEVVENNEEIENIETEASENAEQPVEDQKNDLSAAPIILVGAAIVGGVTVVAGATYGLYRLGKWAFKKIKTGIDNAKARKSGNNSDGLDDIVCDDLDDNEYEIDEDSILN